MPAPQRVKVSALAMPRQMQDEKLVAFYKSVEKLRLQGITLKGMLRSGKPAKDYFDLVVAGLPLRMPS